jgi:hypothetical protein
MMAEDELSFGSGWRRYPERKPPVKGHYVVCVHGNHRYYLDTVWDGERFWADDYYLSGKIRYWIEAPVEEL